jgi:hypothetical protein
MDVDPAVMRTPELAIRPAAAHIYEVHPIENSAREELSRKGRS